MRKLRHRGIFKVGWVFTSAAAAYNLVTCRRATITRPRICYGPPKRTFAHATASIWHQQHVPAASAVTNSLRQATSPHAESGDSSRVSKGRSVFVGACGPAADATKNSSLSHKSRKPGEVLSRNIAFSAACDQTDEKHHSCADGLLVGTPLGGHFPVSAYHVGESGKIRGCSLWIQPTSPALKRFQREPRDETGRSPQSLLSSPQPSLLSPFWSPIFKRPEPLLRCWFH